MKTNTEQTLIERLMDPRNKTVNPHEVARELRVLFEHKDTDGTRKLRDAYLIGVGSTLKNRCIDEIRAITEENLLYAAQLADRVSKDGHEASGQLHQLTKQDGPIAKFYREAVGYNA